MRISDWSSVVCSSDLRLVTGRFDLVATWFWPAQQPELQRLVDRLGLQTVQQHEAGEMLIERSRTYPPHRVEGFLSAPPALRLAGGMGALVQALQGRLPADRSEEHTSELQSLMRISYAVFCLNKKNQNRTIPIKQDN